MTTEQKLFRVLAGLLLAGMLVTSGCSWFKKSSEPVIMKPSENAGGGWLCEAGKATSDWDCIQSEDIEPQLSARNKAPGTATGDLVPEKRPTAINDPASETIQDTPDSREPRTLPTTPQPIIDPQAARRPSSQRGPAQPAAISRTGNPGSPHGDLTTARDKSASGSAYASLAYRPDEPVRLIDLPENFYTAQLLAVSTKQQIEDFVVAQNLYDMSAARIEQGGQVLYVLLLGIYESKEIAQRAVAAMPAKVQSMEPWIRPIKGLQDAMLRGDQLASTASLK